MSCRKEAGGGKETKPVHHYDFHLFRIFMDPPGASEVIFLGCLLPDAGSAKFPRCFSGDFFDDLIKICF